MSNYITNQSRFVGNRCLFCLALVFSLTFCQLTWAAQEAVVITDKAIIYSSIEMTGPLGYVTRGKRIQVGEIPRNLAQVYPIVISGKVGYIRAKDISFKMDNSDNFVATRFYELTKENYNSHYSVGFINYSSQYASTVTGFDEALNWYGYQIKGEVLDESRWGVHILTTGMWADKGEEQFRTIELGFGGSYMIFELRRFKLNLFAQFLGIPFANYAVGTKFRVNGGGYGGGMGMSATYDVRKRWGVEGSLGVYQTRLTGFDAPDGFESPHPTFSGARTVLSAYYRF